MRETKIEGLPEFDILRTKTQLSSLISQWTIAREWRNSTVLIISETVREGEQEYLLWAQCLKALLYLGSEAQGNELELCEAERVSQLIEPCDKAMQSPAVSVSHHECCCILRLYQLIQRSRVRSNLKDDDSDHRKEVIGVDGLLLILLSLNSFFNLRSVN
jgi:hypothetical protein